MLTALKEALTRIETMVESMNPEDQAYALETLQELAARLESKRQWDELLATPESQAFLATLSAEIEDAIAAGSTVEGGWSL